MVTEEGKEKKQPPGGKATGIVISSKEKEARVLLHLLCPSQAAWPVQMPSGDATGVRKLQMLVGQQ